MSICCESSSGLKVCKPSVRAARRRRWSEATSTNVLSVLRSSVAMSKAERNRSSTKLLLPFFYNCAAKLVILSTNTVLPHTFAKLFNSTGIKIRWNSQFFKQFV